MKGRAVRVDPMDRIAPVFEQALAAGRRWRELAPFKVHAWISDLHYTLALNPEKRPHAKALARS